MFPRSRWLAAPGLSAGVAVGSPRLTPVRTCRLHNHLASQAPQHQGVVAEVLRMDVAAAFGWFVCPSGAPRIGVDYRPVAALFVISRADPALSISHPCLTLRTPVRRSIATHTANNNTERMRPHLAQARSDILAQEQNEKRATATIIGRGERRNSFIRNPDAHSV